MGFSSQGYCSELPFASPGNLPNPVIESGAPVLAGRFFTTEPPGSWEKAVAPHSSTLAWEIPWMEEPGDYSP